MVKCGIQVPESWPSGYERNVCMGILSPRSIPMETFLSHTWQVAKVPEVAHMLSFYPRELQRTLFNFINIGPYYIGVKISNATPPTIMNLFLFQPNFVMNFFIFINIGPYYMGVKISNATPPTIMNLFLFHQTFSNMDGGMDRSCTPQS